MRTQRKFVKEDASDVSSELSYEKVYARPVSGMK
jgi:hypothetical protein